MPQHWLRVCVALNTDEALKGRRFRPSDSTWASGVGKTATAMRGKTGQSAMPEVCRSILARVFAPAGDRSTRPRTSLAPQRVPTASSLKPVVLACLRQQSGWQGAVLPAKNAACIPLGYKQRRRGATAECAVPPARVAYGVASGQRGASRGAEALLLSGAALTIRI